MTVPQPLLSALQAGTIAAFLVSIVTGLIVTPIIVRGAAARGLFEPQRGGDRGPDRRVSRLGGISVFMATIAGLLTALSIGAIEMNAESARLMPSVIIGGTLTFLLGLYDDIRVASARFKLVVQLLIAVIVYVLGTRIGFVTVADAQGIETGLLSLPLTVLWIVGVMNAVNLIDGLDGLATGIGLVVLSAVTLAAMLLGNLLVVTVALALVGALLGFLRYNISPAKIFLGDSGSLTIGFMLAVLTIHGSLKSTTAVLVAIPIFALAVPLLDTSVAIARRYLRGTPVFGADARHIHHRLLAIGLTPGHAASLMWGLTAAFAVYGLSIAFAPRPFLLRVAVCGGLVAMALVLFGVRRLDYVEFVEAATALVRRGGGVRREIRDQIHARETAELLATVTSLRDLNSLLAERRYRFGFAQMEVNRVDLMAPAPTDGAQSLLLKLDYPVTAETEPRDDQLWLRIWCSVDAQNPTHGAVRVARILAPAIDGWIRRGDGAIPPRSPRLERRRSGSARADGEFQFPLRDAATTNESPWPAV